MPYACLTLALRLPTPPYFSLLLLTPPYASLRLVTPPSPRCQGRVVGPSFHFSLEEIAFGTVSLGFLNTKTFHLHNTSEIPLRFALRVPEDCNPLYKEFAIIPATGVVLPHGKQRLQLELVSYSVKKYNLSLQARLILPSSCPILLPHPLAPL